jgi:hypothetical protein
MGGAYMVCGLFFRCVSDNQQKKSIALEQKSTATNSPPVPPASLLCLPVEASAFLIATQLKKVLIQRNPVSFLIVGLGAIGAGFYGNKYYRAVIKGEHVRRFNVEK